MNQRVFSISAWSGTAALVVTCVGWLIAGILPLPLGPSTSTIEVAAFFIDDATVTKMGFVIASVGVGLMLPMLAAISMHMLRMEGRYPLLSFTQMIAGAVTVILNTLPQLLWATIAFRTDRTPEEYRTLNDIAWLLLFTGIIPFMIQNIAIGTAVLSAPHRVFPRWVGFLNLWVALAFVPDVLAYFFMSGPFAWNGIFVFWLALGAYAVFLVGMGVAIKHANAQIIALAKMESASA
ncbi:MULTISPECIES: hypothetical protein [unclassified Pseudomonas]|jgi:hypothetical protein|uniref:hypothetical protein n=1 Tax=unclassified Pseudomonas TaxID=196821 RepID=UPI000876E417|nr:MULTISPECIES: hypothetical protein [unclassified Pseudomonas]SCZ20773.1 hypothetical protein SAMN03159405_00560 [Pseudomonas sp. NFACC44-2]SDA43765.1 hypothetical protein SAMN03159429_00341 [Pseudomonas sp. NFACC51]SFH10209.1 hypothetical protein SAMN03159302_00558 [Pseudomonas sp. NFACC54]SFS43923.1 hypothetical protein SAMN03159306_00559 [Pseudomonas sp. NFACC48-1]